MLRRRGRETFSWTLRKKWRRLYSILRRRILIYLIPIKEKGGDINSSDLRSYVIDGVNYRSNSQSGQDLFAQMVFKDVNNCNYLEIGSSWPDKNSNTYILEIDCGWRGLSVDIDPKTVSAFNDKRRNLAFEVDATRLDYLSFCSKNSFRPIFQYLSLDIDPSFQTYFALKKVMLDGIDFSIITFEHDKYRSGRLVQKASAILLAKRGYLRVAKDVRAKNFRKYEDWWVSTLSFDYDEVEKIKHVVNLVRHELQV